jgi:DNA helicase HerA-like ATPase
MERDCGQPRAYRVTELPRHADPRSDGRAQRAAALTAAYHAGLAGAAGRAGGTGGAVRFGWVRTAPGQPVRIIVAGDALTGSTDAADGSVLLALPGSARGAALAPGELDDLLGRLGCWREIGGISDGLLRVVGHGAAGYGPARYGPGRPDGDEDGRGGNEGGQGAALSLDETLLGSWTGPFGWMVTAEPLAAARLRALAAAAGLRQRLAEGSADRSPEHAALARRLKERHAELERGISAGFWRISVTAGGTDEECAARVAGLLCAAADLGGLPYALSPGLAPSPRPAPGDLEPGGDGMPASPFYGSTELLAALTRPPASEVPGVRLALRPEFDVTPEPDGTDGVRLGTVLDRNLMPAGPFTVPSESLNRHMFVCGATGAGKSQTVRSLLEAAAARGVPWLVIEPAKAEYRLMAGRLPGTEVIRIRPGEPDAIAAGLNPLEPAASEGGRFPLQTHADLIRALFIASFQAEEPFPQVLSAALSRVYEEAGWDLALGEPVHGGNEARFPTLTDLQRAAERVVSEIGYSQRVTDDVLGFMRVRLASLRHGTTGRFLEGGHPLDFAAVLRKNIVLEIEDVGDDGDKAFLMGAVLIRLVEYLRLTRRTAPGLCHLTVVEEAHRLLRRSEPGAAAGGAAGHAVEMFAGLLAEIRAYGEGLVIAEQIPARLSQDAIKNTAVKVVHRLPAADDREAVGATMNATPAQSRYLVTLSPGQAAAFCDGMDFPVLVRIDDGTERERAAAIPTADALSVVRPRSATCGRQCAARPCTLRDLRTARRALEDMSWVSAWAELSVLAHLTGWPPPVPKPEVLAPFAALPARVTQCALSHAVEAAAAARPGITAALPVHVTAALSARTERGAWLCRLDEPEWLARGPVTGGASVSAEVLASFIGADWAGTMEPELFGHPSNGYNGVGVASRE